MTGIVVAISIVALLGVTVGVFSNDVGKAPDESSPGQADPPGDSTPVATPESTPTTIGFIGDSWSNGTGTDGGMNASYAALAADQLGWEYRIFAGGGTGYLKSNPVTGDHPFGDRVDGLIEFAPDVVVVQGSSNDSAYAAEDIERAAEQLFTTLRRELPDATVYALGVFDSPAADDVILATSRQGVAQAAERTSIIYIDPSDDEWLDLKTDFADGFHPDSDGHRKVARQLALQLDPALVG